MRTVFLALGALILLQSLTSREVDLTELATSESLGRVVNRSVLPLPDPGVRFDERPGQGIAWIRGVRFSTGVIDVDVRGKDLFQRSFVGVAFRGASDARYEAVYLRPFNFRTEDPVRRVHAIQYVAHPELTWEKLRSERPGEFESGASGAVDPTDWVRLRLDISTDRVRGYIGSAPIPWLDVPRLGSIREGLVGLWVGEGSGGDFRNLTITSDAPRPLDGFPVTPEVFLARFSAAEGITFNAEGRLFVGADSAIWIVEPNGSARKIADVHTHLGQARIGARDILAADFGPRNVFQHGPNDDGIVWRITPEGEKTAVARGIADPNAIVVLRDGSYLVSDDGTDKIYRVQNGAVSVWSSAVAYLNGLALSPDARVLYVAQIFNSLRPIVGDDRVWAFNMTGAAAPPAPSLIARTGEGGLDGLATDEHGRVYIADNGAGKIWRLDPRNGETILIAEGMVGVASLVFGEGRFDHEAIYATSTQRGGGKIWKLRVGAGGARLYQ